MTKQGIGDRTALLSEMIQLVSTMDSGVIDTLESTGSEASGLSCIGAIDNMAAGFGIIPRLRDLHRDEYLKWIQILRFVCHPDKHVQTLAGVRNSTRLFSVVDRCFRQHRDNWIDRVTRYVQSEALAHRRRDRIRSRQNQESRLGSRYIRLPTVAATMNSRPTLDPEALRRFRQTVLDADIHDPQSLDVLNRSEERQDVISSLQTRMSSAAEDARRPGASVRQRVPALTMAASLRQKTGCGPTCEKAAILGVQLEITPEVYKRLCTPLYQRRQYLDNWVTRAENGRFLIRAYSRVRDGKRTYRGRAAYYVRDQPPIDERGTEQRPLVSLVPPPIPGSISEADYQGTTTQVEALVRHTLHLLGTLGGRKWSVYTFMVRFFDRLLAVALLNFAKIDVLTLYRTSQTTVSDALTQAHTILWSLVRMDTDQEAYMVAAIQWAQASLSEAPEFRHYTDYRFTTWVSDILLMIDGTEHQLALQAIGDDLSTEDVFGLDVNGLARWLEMLVQATSLPVYYTRMVDKMLTIIGRCPDSSVRHLHQLIESNRVQIEYLMHQNNFEIESITGHDVDLDDVLIIADTIFEELLPMDGVGGLYTEVEAPLDRRRRVQPRS